MIELRAFSTRVPELIAHIRQIPPWIADPLIDDLDDQVSLSPRTNYQPAPGVLAQDQRTVIST